MSICSSRRARSSNGARPSPAGAPRRAIGLAELGPELARGGRAARLSVPLVAGDELVGSAGRRGSTAVDLARAVASQTAVGIKKIQLIERLTEKNLIKDFFEELAGGRVSGDLEGRAARLGCDLDAAARRARRRSRRTMPSSASLAARCRVRCSIVARIRCARCLRVASARTRERWSTEPCGAHMPRLGGAGGSRRSRASARGAAELRRRFRGGAPGGARDSRAPARADGDGVRGAGRLQVPAAHRRRGRRSRRHRRCDLEDSPTTTAQRGASLLSTLEEFLRRRGSISATSEALYVHPNTLRQRLRRIAELTGLDLRGSRTGCWSRSR